MSSGATRRTTIATRKGTQKATNQRRVGMGRSNFKSAWIMIIFVVLIFGGFAVFKQVELQNKQIEAQKAQAALKQKLEMQAREMNAKISYIVSNTDIPKDTQINATLLSTQEFPKNTKIDGAFISMADPTLLGLYAKYDIPKGQIVLKSMLALDEPVLKSALKAGEEEIKMDISNDQAELSYMTKGNNITLYSIQTTKGGNKIVTTIAKKARILVINKPKKQLFNTITAPVAQVATAPAKTNNNGTPNTLQTAPTTTTISNNDSMTQTEAVKLHLALSKEDAKLYMRQIQEGNRVIITEKPSDIPPSTATVLQVWNGVEMTEKEINDNIGATIYQRNNDTGMNSNSNDPTSRQMSQVSRY